MTDPDDVNLGHQAVSILPGAITIERIPILEIIVVGSFIEQKSSIRTWTLGVKHCDSTGTEPSCLESYTTWPIVLGLRLETQGFSENRFR